MIIMCPLFVVFLTDDELVGIDSMSKELIGRLIKESSKGWGISLVGEGGIGKTTLAKKVYNDVVAKQHFYCHVWITVSQSYDLETILKIMKKNICPKTKQTGGKIDKIVELRDLLKNSLMTKRYMVVFDDVWNPKFWDDIKDALPNNDNGSKIILTTRNASVVESFMETTDGVVKELKTWPEEQSWELFCKKVFRCSDINGCCPPDLEQLSRELLSKCQGLPLAIVAVAGLLSRKKSKVEWQKIADSFSYEFERNDNLSNISKVLLLSYQDLPSHLRSFFLYFGIFPADYRIGMKRLYRLWIAEGFVKSTRHNSSLEQIAEGYLTELIQRNMVSYEVVFGSERRYGVHDLFHEVILTRIDDRGGFCNVFKENTLWFQGSSRRLSIYGDIGNALKAVGDCKLRSVFLFKNNHRDSSLLIRLFKSSELLEVLDLRDAPLDNLPEEVGKLFNLKYLDLNGTNVEMLPKSIGNLHDLQTLDLGNTSLQELPDEIGKLRKLRHLYAYSIAKKEEFSMCSFCGVTIHKEVGKLEELQSLTLVDAYLSGMDVVKELCKLSKLRVLGVSNVNSELGAALGNSINNMKQLEELYLSATNANEVLDLDCVSSPSTSFDELRLSCRLKMMPKWISKLENLQRMELNFSRMEDEPLKHLKNSPNLAYLHLHDAYVGAELHFEKGSFRKLKQLLLRKLEGLKVLKIDRGALHLLDKLDFGPSPLMKEMPSNIQHLRNLKSLSIYDMPPKFVIALQPDGGTEHCKIKRISYVEFGYYTGNFNLYHFYKLGSPDLVQRLHNKAA